MTHTHHANMGRCTQYETLPERTPDMTNPTEIVAEAVREYVGDGDGADKEVLAAYEQQIRAHLQHTNPNVRLTPQRLAELRTTADNANYVVILKRHEARALLDAADALPDIIRQAKEEAWDEALQARAGSVPNPYRADRIEQGGQP